jgi:hypothetical protein
MRAQRRALPNVLSVLERLDTRVVPASIGPTLMGATALFGSLSPGPLPDRLSGGIQVQTVFPGGVSVSPGIGQFLGSLGIQFEQGSPPVVQGPSFGGTPRQAFNPGGVGPGHVVRPLGTALFQVNVPPALPGTGTGASVMALGGGFGSVRDHALGRQPVVVGLQGPGIGMFTSNLAIRFLQGSAGLIQPFNAVPGVGLTVGFAIV